MSQMNPKPFLNNTIYSQFNYHIYCWSLPFVIDLNLTLLNNLLYFRKNIENSFGFYGPRESKNKKKENAKKRLNLIISKNYKTFFFLSALPPPPTPSIQLFNSWIPTPLLRQFNCLTLGFLPPYSVNSIFLLLVS